MNKDISSWANNAAKPLVVIVGATGSGKSSLAVDLAIANNGEIINADSRQLYKHLDIGTGKITSNEMKGIPHHLLDVFEPTEEATAGWFQLEARKEIDDIHSRNKVPMLVGGSMLYIASITDGLTMAPATDGTIRDRLEAEYDSDDGQTLHQRLQEVDRQSAAAIHQNNKPRLVRALEIYELTGKPKSEAIPHTELGEGNCEYDLTMIGIDWDREVLHDRINKRCDNMFEIGWVDEVKNLVSKGYTSEDPGMKSVGYREIIGALESGEPMADVKEVIKAKTRQYARRQLTWWRGDDRIEWISGSEL